MRDDESKVKGRWPGRCFLLAGLLLATAVPGLADDRDLLRKNSGRPYVLILLDTSASMAWAPKCTQADVNAGICSFLCPSGDCFTPLNSDDVAAKFYQAKAALYEVLGQVTNVDFGFATYNQDGLYLRSKHWLYQATGNGATIPGFGAYPATGTQEVFGYQWACDLGTTVGCLASDPADLSVAWERERMRRLSKGGVSFNQVQTFYVRASASSPTHRVTYTPQPGVLGALTITVQAKVERCTNASCSSRTLIGQPNVSYTRLSDFNSLDLAANPTPIPGTLANGYFGSTSIDLAAADRAIDSPAGNTCAGWDPNTDSNADLVNGYRTRFPTVTHPTFSQLNEGDVVPLDWSDDNRDEILRRLAPNLVLGETTPDFRTARYFQDLPSGGLLRLKNEAARPLVANGFTPLGTSVDSIRTWFNSWKTVAAANDPEWGCRNKYLIVLTDGDETCPTGSTAACGATTNLRNAGMKTYVVAYGVQTGSNVLTCMATNGGTGAPIFPQNKQALVAALTQIFLEVKEESRAFASAAVPSVQAQTADKIILTNFTPINPPPTPQPGFDSSVWSGHVDAYLKPLPLTADKKPNKSRKCSASIESSCHAWDAGEKLFLQAPTPAEAASGTYKIGNLPEERRVYFVKNAVGDDVPRDKHLFVPPPAVPDKLDLWSGMGITPVPAATAEQKAKDVIAFTLRKKKATIDKPGGGTEDIDYVLGDIFHSNPRVVSSPDRFRYFVADLESNGKACNDAVDPNPGYRCFFKRHEWRRKVVVFGSNDGQLHAADAGRFSGSVTDGRVEGTFDNGTGSELFSIIPRVLLPQVKKLLEQVNQDWGMDGTVQLDDVFIDPSHLGTPDPDEREWRSVLIGGLREGGRSYIAVDVTQPDKYEPGGFFIPASSGSYVPSCLTSYTVQDCGPVKYPTVLWEFTDSLVPNEDGTGGADLGETWSTPNTGILRVIENSQPAEKFVAVFGGGMDPAKDDQAGNWLYIVDIETGEAIYKRRLDGSAPSEPAAVDTDQDGVLDTIYIGTTAGFLYKVDVSTPQPIQDVTILGTPVQRITAAEWAPFKIFDTGGLPIYFPPAVVYVGQLQSYALAFGSGDREDLWAFDQPPGRFYMVLDPGLRANDPGGPSLPLTEASFQQIQAEGNECTGGSVLFTPPSGKLPGWFMALEEDERVITKAFSLSGITVFTSYAPQLVVNPGPPPLCARTGTSRIFTVFTDSANAVIGLDAAAGGGSGACAPPGGGGDSDPPSRFWEVPEFVTDPFTEQSVTKNPLSGEGAPPHSDQMTEPLRNVMETLKGMFPRECKFANYTINLKTIRSDTGVVFIAPVPICLIERNWKEF